MNKMRIGHGYDVHAFEEGDGIILGGVRIPYDKKLKGHSDADVLAHAVSDAILGAAGLRDIGYHFPDTDPKWEGADSMKLLAKCLFMAENEDYALQNVDVTIIAQTPKLMPYIELMQHKLRDLFHDYFAESDINIKATTHEKLGALGRGEGIAVHAIALLLKN